MKLSDAQIEATQWWPPKAGEKLRHHTFQSGSYIEALVHVLAVFDDKDGAPRIVAAEWSPSGRGWKYEVYSRQQAARGIIWPDGTQRPVEL